VRGRFCLPEATHHHSRALKPMLRRGKFFRVVDWDEALDEVAERLAGVPPDDLLVLASADLTNESLFAAQRLVRTGLGSGGIDSTGGVYLPGGPALWSRLFSLPISIAALGEADAVVVAGLDSRFSFSVVGVQARRALRRGARLVAVDARESNLARMADHHLRSEPGQEAFVLAQLLQSLQDAGTAANAAQTALVRNRGNRGRSSVADAAKILAGGDKLAVLIGPRVFDCPGAGELVAALENLAGRDGVTIVPLAHGTNIRGALEMGALAGVLPGPQPAAEHGQTLAGTRAGLRPRVLYLIGEIPFATRPSCDYIIVQDLYLPPFEVDAFLPAASFAEAGGTLTSIEGRVQAQHAVEHMPPSAVNGFALPDWRILSDIAERLGTPRLRYADAAAVRAAIHAELPDFPAEPDRAPRRMKPFAASGASLVAAPDGVAGTGRFVLVQEHAAFRHRGSDLSGMVEGLNELHLEEGLRMNPEDMARLGVEPDGMVTVSFARRAAGDPPVVDRELVLPVRPDQDCPQGAVYVSRVEAWGCLSGRAGLEQLTHAPARPVRVRVQRGNQSCPAKAKQRRREAMTTGTVKDSSAKAR
jgi:anaerobic selenocysteine-containing dehydrogenase